MSYLQDALKLNPIEGRLSVAERAAYIQGFLECSRSTAATGRLVAAEGAYDACAEVAVMLGRHITPALRELRATLEAAEAACSRCGLRARELLRQL